MMETKEDAMRHVNKMLLATTAVALLGAAAAAPPALADAAGRTERASVGSAGQQSALFSFQSDMSGDGNRVVFRSAARDEFGAVDPAAASNIFLRDRAAGSTTLVSVNDARGPGNRESLESLISLDGGTVVFASIATNLVLGDANLRPDVFARDLAAGTTSLVSLATDGTQGNGTSVAVGITTDGRYVAFNSVSSNFVPSTGTGHLNLFVRDRETGTTTLETVGFDGSPADGPPFSFSVLTDATFTPNGRYIAFDNNATNLVPDDTNGKTDVFVRDRREGLTRLVSVAKDGGSAEGNSFKPLITSDGRYVVFGSEAPDLVEGDTNKQCDIFVRDLRAGETRRLARAADGGQINGCSAPIALTPNGRYLLFISVADNIMPGVPSGTVQYYRLDLTTGEVVLISRNNQGEPGNGKSRSLGGISNSGRIAAFDSNATNLVEDDTNGQFDVFVRTVGSGDAVATATATAARASGEPAALVSAGSAKDLGMAADELQPEGW
jgi:Tol biopolymer transport system component